MIARGNSSRRFSNSVEWLRSTLVLVDDRERYGLRGIEVNGEQLCSNPDARFPERFENGDMLVCEGPVLVPLAVGNCEREAKFSQKRFEEIGDPLAADGAN